MKVKTSVVLLDCIENGINSGWYRAHKHCDNPTEGDIKNAISWAIESQVAEYFVFDDELPIDR